MINVIKMDLFRMFKTKSLYVVWLTFILLIVFSTIMIKDDYSEEAIQQENYQTTVQESADENLGMNVILPTKPGTHITIYDTFYANVKGKAVALFIVIFAVIFSTADMKSGFIKNIGGQVKNRISLVLSKALILTLFTVLTMFLFLGVQGICNQMVFGYLKWGPWKEFLSYFGLSLLLHIAFAMIVMAAAIIIQNNVFSMALAVCLCMNLIFIIYSFFDKAAAAMHIKNFHFVHYTVTGKIAMLPIKMNGKDIRSAVIVGIVYLVISLVFSSFVVQKRDLD